jgi:hypothetical protein
MIRLKVKWKIFYNQINDYIIEAEDILKLKKEYCTTKSYEYTFNTINSWINNCYSYLKGSFNLSNNVYAERFYSEKSYDFYVEGDKSKEQQKFDEIFRNLSAKKISLERSLRILSVSDAIIQPELVDLELRKSFNIKEIVELLFDKLYHLYDNIYYPIFEIIHGNGIKLKHYHEFLKLIKKYETDLYINLINTSSICGKLTKKGREAEEKKRKFDFYDKVCLSQPEVLDLSQTDLYKNLDNPDLSQNYMRKELENLKLLNSIIFKNDTNSLVVLMSQEQIFYLNIG